MKKNVWKFITR